MKKQIITALIAIGATAGAFAQQSTVTFDNGNANPAATLSSKSFGLIFWCPGSSIIPVNQDINVALLGGPSAGSLSLIAALTFANGGAQGDVTAFGEPGVFSDLSGNIYTVPGVAGGGTAFFQVEAWLGSATDYVSATIKGSSATYSGVTGGGGIPAGPPTSIGDGMPSFLVGDCPEPTTLAFGGLGAAALLFLRRKR